MLPENTGLTRRTMLLDVTGQPDEFVFTNTKQMSRLEQLILQKRKENNKTTAPVSNELLDENDDRDLFTNRNSQAASPSNGKKP